MGLKGRGQRKMHPCFSKHTPDVYKHIVQVVTLGVALLIGNVCLEPASSHGRQVLAILVPFHSVQAFHIKSS